jgi:hypothetical protein
MQDHGRPAPAQPAQAPRAATRYKVFELSELSVGTDCARAHVINVSETGALIHTDARAEKGSQVGLKIGDDWYPARVMWVALPRLGIAFNGRLPGDVLARLLGA